MQRSNRDGHDQAVRHDGRCHPAQDFLAASTPQTNPNP
ncbi:hypothetical protein OH687_06640 [Burkholderia anthina]|nr:hypothetical protein OH687_06640 [Burkholderia anthina]